MCTCVCVGGGGSAAVNCFSRNLTGPEFVIYRNSHHFCFNETFFLFFFRGEGEEGGWRERKSRSC